MNDYKLVWEETFDRDGAPDAANWNFETGFVRNHEAQWYQPDNAKIRGKKLVIEARREKRRNPTFDASSDDWRKKNEFIEYTSSSLTTRGKREFLYGRFELRGKIDVRQGMWPAFWTLGVDREWPASGEIDIMEFYRGKLLANVAWGTERRWTAKWDSTATPLAELGGEKWARDFHVWRMDWDETAIRLFVDNRLLNETLLKDARNPDGSSGFTQPHYILVNLAVGGDNGGDPTPTQFPARFEIDWIRVWQSKGKG